MPFTTVDLLDPTQNLGQQIEAFLDSDALAALTSAFSLVPTSGSLTLDQRLTELDELTTVWDFRRGNERNIAAATTFDPQVEQTVQEAAEALGLVHSRTPRYTLYDHVLILGGLVRACFSRAGEAGRLLHSGQISAESVTALGGFRPLGGDEFDLATALGHTDLSDEFDAMEAGVRTAFGLKQSGVATDEGEESDQVGGAWRVRTLATPDKQQLRVVAAPSSDPTVRRANTADTYAWFADRLADLRPGDKVLLVTSAIYLQFQHADAIRMLHLPYGADIDTVGVATPELDPPLRQHFGADKYLQEVRSTIRSFRALSASL